MREGFYITLTKIDKEQNQVFVFVSNIECVEASDKGCVITMNSGKTLAVKETFDYIVKQSERYGVIKKAMM